MSDARLLQVKNLVKDFPVRKSNPFARREVKRAVDNVSFEVACGKTLALVGESGSGKTTVGLMLLDLLTPTSGDILFNGRASERLSRGERMARRREMQVVFQDPYASLNPRMNVRETLTEGMIVHRIGSTAHERDDRAAELLREVGMAPESLDRYPHEFSGGQRQRIAIARALSVNASFLVLDEPTSALDVSIQSQVLNLLRRLQRERGLTYLFITHNLDVVGYLSDEVAVMERGQIVERGTVDQIFDNPREAYTRRLLDAIPSVESIT